MFNVFVQEPKHSTDWLTRATHNQDAESIDDKKNMQSHTEKFQSNSENAKGEPHYSKGALHCTVAMTLSKTLIK